MSSRRSRFRRACYGVAVLLGSLFTWVACDDDEDYTYPSLLNELADVTTDASGHFVRLVTDAGSDLPVTNSTEIPTDGVTPDTLYRALVGYELDDEGAVLYSLQAISAPVPEVLSSPSVQIKDDPLEMQSIWRGGKYLNMALLVKTQGGRHRFRVVEERLVNHVSGNRALYLILSHDAHDDLPAYTSKVYLSVPLSAYSFTADDTVKIKIPTREGWQEWER